MEKILEGIASNIVVIVAIFCYAGYEICALKKKPTKSERYEELRTLHELREKGIITQAEFDEKKTILLEEE
jgi:hypothetical protein